MDLKGKTAIITGGSRGLGKEIAIRLAELGANISINSSSDDAIRVAEEIKAQGYNCLGFKVNVKEESEVEEMVEKTKEAFGTIDILVNNAGITKDTLLIRMTEQDWDDVLDINLKGTFLFTRAVTKIMMKQRKGKVINISSIVGEIGNPGQANYSASKAGMIGFAKSVAKEFASRNITCNVIAPGFIETQMTDKLPENIKENYLSNIPLKRFGTPREVANLVAFLGSDLSNYINGQVINVDGGLVM